MHSWTSLEHADDQAMNQQCPTQFIFIHFNHLEASAGHSTECQMWNVNRHPSANQKIVCILHLVFQPGAWQFLKDFVTQNAGTRLWSDPSHATAVQFGMTFRKSFWRNRVFESFPTKRHFMRNTRGCSQVQPHMIATNQINFFSQMCTLFIGFKNILSQPSFWILNFEMIHCVPALSWLHTSAVLSLQICHGAMRFSSTIGKDCAHSTCMIDCSAREMS